MARYLMLALNGPTGGDGDEAAYQRWYEDEHLPAFKAIDAVRSARRYKVLRGKLPGMEAWPYVTAYEIETDDLASLSATFAKRFSEFPPTLDREHSAHLMMIQISGDD
jgi:hypothetical protein